MNAPLHISVAHEQIFLSPTSGIVTFLQVPLDALDEIEHIRRVYLRLGSSENREDCVSLQIAFIWVKIRIISMYFYPHLPTLIVLPECTDIQKCFELGQVIGVPKFFSLNIQSGISSTDFVVFVFIVQS